MTHVIIALDGNTYIHKDFAKTADELCREIRLGCFESPVAMKDPTAVRLQNYLLVAERETSPLLSANQISILELLSQGASEGEMGRAMQLSRSGIRHHVETLKQKFNVGTREELIAVFNRNRAI